MTKHRIFVMVICGAMVFPLFAANATKLQPWHTAPISQAAPAAVADHGSVPASPRAATRSASSTVYTCKQAGHPSVHKAKSRAKHVIGFPRNSLNLGIVIVVDNRI